MALDLKHSHKLCTEIFLLLIVTKMRRVRNSLWWNLRWSLSVVLEIMRKWITKLC